MGAGEKSETKSKAVEPSLDASEQVEESLDGGWSIQILEGGQLLLVPPPKYAEPESRRR